MAHRPTPQKLSPAVAIRSLAPTTLRQPYRRHRPIVRAPEAHAPEAAEAARCARLAGLGAPAWAAGRTVAADRRADRRTFCLYGSRAQSGRASITTRRQQALRAAAQILRADKQI